MRVKNWVYWHKISEYKWVSDELWAFKNCPLSSVNFHCSLLCHCVNRNLDLSRCVRHSPLDTCQFILATCHLPLATCKINLDCRRWTLAKICQVSIQVASVNCNSDRPLMGRVNKIAEFYLLEMKWIYEAVPTHFIPIFLGMFNKFVVRCELLLRHFLPPIPF